MKRILLSLFITSSVLAAHADEGMWMLTDLQKQNEVAMTELGLLIPANQIYNPDGIALKDAVVHFGGGCTGEVISAEGLVLTNHHCGYGAIQQHSSVEHDYLTDGFWAMSREEELPCKGLTVTYIDRILDVTDYVNEQLKTDDDPNVLVLVAAKAGLQAGETAVGEHLGGVAHHQLHVLVLVHAVQVHGLVQVGVEEPAIQAAAKLAVGVFTGLGEQDPLQRDLLIVVLADVQVIVKHHQVGCAGTGALRVDAKGVPGTVLFLVTSHRGPGKGAVGIPVATHQCKGLHGVFVGHIVQGAGADGNIQAVVVLHHIPDAAAVDAVGIAVSRVVEQALGICDLGKALLRVGGDQQGGTALAGGGVHGHVADITCRCNHL